MNDGGTPLYIAAQNGHLSVVTALLANSRVNPNQATIYGKTPLYIAQQNGHLSVVTAFLANLRVNNQATSDGETPLYIAAEYGHLSLVTALLANSRVQPNHARNDGATPLYIAAENGHLSVVTALLEETRVNPNQAKSNGATPLYIAVKNGHLSVVKALLRDGWVNPNKATNDGATPLYIAARQGNLSIVTELLAHPQVNPHQAMRDSSIPLYVAALCEHFDVVKALLQHQHSIPTNTQLLISAQKGYSTFVRTLLLDKRIRDSYLEQIIKSPGRIHDVLIKNPVFFTELTQHRKACWKRLKDPVHFNLSSDEYIVLLRAILDSRLQPNEALHHPLYALFKEPKKQVARGFCGLFSKPDVPILDDIQAHLDRAILCQRQGQGTVQRAGLIVC